MSKSHAVDDLSNIGFEQFQRDLIGDEMAHQLARVTINWGRVEQAMYFSARSIDKKEAAEWVADFFSKPMLPVQKSKARASLNAAVEKSYPALINEWDAILTDLKDIQTRRNLLSHGLWIAHGKEGRFMVHPLRYDTAKSAFETPVDVDHIYIGNVLQDMDETVQRFAWIAAEFMAHQQLKKWDQR
jgi:hypothetical protein